MKNKKVYLALKHLDKDGIRILYPGCINEGFEYHPAIASHSGKLSGDYILTRFISISEYDLKDGERVNERHKIKQVSDFYFHIYDN